MARSEDNKKRQRSAGFIVLRPDGDGDWRVLILHSSVVKKGRIVAQVWDIPKGHVNPGESDFAAALRETQEETQFDQRAVTKGMRWKDASYTVVQKNKDVVLFLTEWDETNPDPEFFENAESGIKEHDEFVWADWQLAFRTVYPAMQNGIVWAYSVAHDCTPAEAMARITGEK
jgi:bis(5'-nucleosidyl)-tetraphosphatase